MKPQEKHKFIIVRHSWFGGNSHGWSEREFEGTQEEVDKEATFSKGEIYDTFKSGSKDLLLECIGLTSQQILHQTISFIDTWDNYILSVIYVTLFYRLINTYHLSDTIINKLITYLLQSIVSYPSERHTSHYMFLRMDQLLIENNNWDFVNNMSNSHIKFNIYV